MMIRLAAILLTGFISAISVSTLTAQTAAPPQSNERKAMWKKVEDAVAKGLPKTALEEIKPIIESAIKNKAYAEAIKAVARRASLQTEIEGGLPEVRVRLLNEELAAAPPEMQPMLHTILGAWYWSYFEQNRWRFGNRTAVVESQSTDFTTWDLKRLFAEIDRHYASALANEDELKRTSIETFKDLLVDGTIPDSYRPTVFDFLAFQAVGFYSSGEQAGAQAEDVFEIEASGPAIGPANDFVAWKPTTTDSESPKLKAILLYQKLLTFHRDDADRSAFLDADLGRLQFAYSHAIGDEKGARYKSALKTIAENNPQHPLSATARFRLAEVLQGEGDLLGARENAMQGRSAFPNSQGGKQCHNLIQSIEAPSINVTTERVWNDPFSPLRVRYRNLTKVNFRLVKLDWKGRFTNDRWNPNQLNQKDVETLAMLPAVANWSASLPATEDYREATFDVEPPKNLAPGYYFVIASARDHFRDNDNTLSATEVWVSNLALVIRQTWGNGKLDGFVLNAKSGEPVAGATVKTYERNPQNSRVAEGRSVTTDANGVFTIQGDNSNFFLIASHAGNEISSISQLAIQSHNYEQPVDVQYVLFSDRAIYRPGQTIYFKGVAILADPTSNKYAVVPNRNVTASLRDVNGAEIANLPVKTNDFGSFSGSFTAPRDRGTGHMSIVVQDGRAGMVGFNVEEYKRPKFQVTVDAPKEAAKLASEVKVTGKATAYTGAAVNGAKVRYRISRQTQWPHWFMSCFYWRLPPNYGNAQEIAHGWATTQADGSFEIKFTATPDRSVPESDQPTFHYTVTADVTDATGETRTGSKTIAAGYTALAINVSADEWQETAKPATLRLSTSSLDGEPQSAKGSVKIHRLKEPANVIRPDLLGARSPAVARPRGRGAAARPMPTPIPAPTPDPSDPKSWELGEVVESREFSHKEDGKSEFALELSRGNYRVVVESQDRFGKPATAQWNIQVVDRKSDTLGLKVPNLLAAPKWELEPGTKLEAIWGSGYATSRAFVEVEHRGKLLQSYWTPAGKTQVAISQDVAESMRGGFTVRTTMVRENRAYFESRHVNVPWSNKDLTLKWKRFVSKLEPAAKETFSLTITGPNAVNATAEMVATLYDASLDAFAKQQWMQRLNVFYQDYSRLSSQFNNHAATLAQYRGQWGTSYLPIDVRYRDFPPELKAYMFYGPGGFGGGRPRMMRGGAGGAPGAPMALESAAPAMDMAMAKSATTNMAALGATSLAEEAKASGSGNIPDTPAIDLGKVSVRTNLNETAFFFPSLVSNSEGEVKLEFTMPEALTTWRFLGFAHDKELRSGYLEDSIVTAKDLMVQPNPPRFLREGDFIEFSAKVSNVSDKMQTGKVALKLFDARTDKPMDGDFGNATIEQTFTIPAGETRGFVWPLRVPDGSYPIIYRVVGATEKMSDGEEGMLPVLSKRILVTESLPLPIRGKSTKEFRFDKLLNSGASDTLKHQSLSVQMTSQPAWYAVLALPYLMEFPHECSEQTFNRLYANSLAQHIAGSDPKIKRVFDTWRNFQPEASNSPLTKNQDVKSVMIEETPWLRDSNRESESRRNVAILFEANRLETEVANAMKKLTDMQRENGMWPWFPGGRDNEYLSLYIVTGFGRLRNLKVDIDVSPALRAVDRLDAWMHEQYDEIQRRSKNPEDNHLSTTSALYLYGRSFFLKDHPINDEHRVAIDYWQRQARKYWLQIGNRQSQAHIAIGLKRFGDKETPKSILESIKEHSVSNEEMGMFWRDTEQQGWWWYHAPIETQAMMIEAFDEVADDSASVEECKVWLLKQKQTQNWKTTKATADAVYALLLRGSNMLASDALVEVKLAGEAIEPTNVEAGTGFYEQKFGRGEIKPNMGAISVTKSDAGVSWGAIHWQYLEDISKVSPHDGTPLKLEKQLFKRELTKSGPVLQPIIGPVQIGDEIVCRIILRTDRDMEYVHLKDHRGSGTEPTNVLSRYKFQDGLAYYESTRDTASHFFIDYLYKGNYVFEYSVRVQLAGQYPTGMASIECMYAPEFNSHSESILLQVESKK